MIKRFFLFLLIAIGVLLKISSVAYAQDTLVSKFHIKLGAEIIPGLSLSWSSKDYRVVPYGRSENKSIIGACISEGIRFNFYFNKIFLTAGALISHEDMPASVPLLNVPHGGRYDLDYQATYLDFPLGIGFILNKNSSEKETFLEFRTSFSFIFYEKIKKFHSPTLYNANGTSFNYNEDVVAKEINYNRTYFFITIGRETPFIRNTPLYFKIALTFITPPINIQRNTTEIFTNERIGIVLGLSYKLK